ncbi:MotA/TolQ/ExbB proton channel family protein, partial [Propionivibrio sp.]
MNVSQDLSILHLILNASAVVQAVMLLLAAVSFMSWYYIFRKWFAVKLARTQTEQFERDFWSGGDLNSLYQSAVNNRHGTGSMERIFESGFREFNKLRSQKNLDPKDVIDGSRRAMRATYQREVDSIDAHLAFLASVGSVSPYVGLFGTVWGIMHS